MGNSTSGLLLGTEICDVKGMVVEKDLNIKFFRYQTPALNGDLYIYIYYIMINISLHMVNDIHERGHVPLSRLIAGEPD